MNPFTIKVPLAGEAISAFKTVSDVFSLLEDRNEKIKQISDEIVQFSMPITLGSFRLLLDGEFEVIDIDLDTHVGLYKLDSKDRGGKGRFDSTFRLWLEESNLNPSLNCEVTPNLKGMIARVELPVERVVSERIERLITTVLENTSVISIDDYELENIEPISLVENGFVESNPKITSRKTPVWVLILQLPVRLITYPFRFFRAFFSA